MHPSDKQVQVTSEIGTLRRLLIHSPDSGLGKVVPSKAQDWLFEDIVHLDTLREEEYDHFVKILLYFLDPGKIRGRLNERGSAATERDLFIPGKSGFHRSGMVVELQVLLSDILDNEAVRSRLVSSICDIEKCSYRLQERLLDKDSVQLANILITGSLEDGEMIFAPIPNFIFSRDLGVVINDHILLNRPAKEARYREAILAKYIFYNHPFFENYRENILEIPGNAHRFLSAKEEGDVTGVTLEGGDVMTITRDHLIIGWSERTSSYAVNQVIKLLFARKVVKKVTVVKIPARRDFMHIDTIFTQVKRNVWVLLDTLSKKVLGEFQADRASGLLELQKDDGIRIMQFRQEDRGQVTYFDYMEDLLDDISRNEFQSKEATAFIYSGNSEFPYNQREQWTDSCNLLALREGVVIGYDRNDKTAQAFAGHGFRVIGAAALTEEFEHNKISPEEVRDTLILLPSAELSRARGGSHCMSLPLLRDELTM